MDLIDRAIEMAAKAHLGQVRKGTDIPYVSHAYTVGMMVAQAGCSDEMVAAAILHDTVEDTHVTLEDVQREFGPVVAAIVEGCSEPDKSLPWEARKRHTLEHLREAPWEVRVVACADKLHNIRSTRLDHDTLGNKVWQRFKRGRTEQEWYYRSLVEILCGAAAEGKRVPFCGELKKEVEKLFGK